MNSFFVAVYGPGAHELADSMTGYRQIAVIAPIAPLQRTENRVQVLIMPENAPESLRAFIGYLDSIDYIIPPHDTAHYLEAIIRAEGAKTHRMLEKAQRATIGY